MSIVADATKGELEVRGLTKYFSVGRALFSREKVHAVDDVSFTLRPGRVTALVGESGSGKSTVARLLLRLYPPTEGSVIFDGRDIASESSRRGTWAYYRLVPEAVGALRATLGGA